MAALKKKDDDMKAMEERYKMYLEKARNVSPSARTVAHSFDFTLIVYLLYLIYNYVSNLGDKSLLG